MQKVLEVFNKAHNKINEKTINSFSNLGSRILE